MDGRHALCVGTQHLWGKPQLEDMTDANINIDPWGKQRRLLLDIQGFQQSFCMMSSDQTLLIKITDNLVVSTVAADVLAPSGARASADTVMSQFRFYYYHKKNIYIYIATQIVHKNMLVPQWQWVWIQTCPTPLHHYNQTNDNLLSTGCLGKLT